MFNTSFTIGRLFGVRVSASPSWVLAFCLVTFSFGSYYIPNGYPTWSPAATWMAAVMVSALFFASVVVHELAHCLVALRNKIPVSGISLFMLGGVSHLGRSAPSPGVELAVGIAGPLTSLGLAGISFGLFWVLQNASPTVGQLFFILGYANAVLGVLNLLPGFPLDGGRMLRALVWFAADDLHWATRIAARAGQFAALTFIAGGAYLLLTRERGSFSSGLWLILLGWFLFSAANQSYRGLAFLEALVGVSVRELMRRDMRCVDSSMNINDLVEHVSDVPEDASIFVVEQGIPIGLLNRSLLMGADLTRLAKAVPKELIRRIDPSQILSEDQPAEQALQLAIEGQLEILPVVREGEVVGQVHLADLVREVARRRSQRR